MFECVRFQSYHFFMLLVHSPRSQGSITHKTQHTGTRKHSSSELSGASGCSRCMFVRTWCVARIESEEDAIMYSLQEQKRESVHTIGSALQRTCQVTSYNFELSRGDVESNHGNGFRTIHSQVLFCDSLRTSSRDSCRGIYDVCDSK